MTILGNIQGLETIQGRIYVAGEWRATKETRTVRSPYNGRPVGAFCWADRKQADEAIASAADAMRNPLPAYQRARILQEAARILRERKDELARIVTLESGKPINLSLGEMARAEQTLLFSSTKARELHGEVTPMDAHPAGTGHLGIVLRLPLGVVAAITPFNFPVNLVAHKIGPALAAGCACVLKPADKTPLSALCLTRIFEQAGLPPGWLNTITGDPVQIVAAFVEDERVKAISFTGSAEVGWRIREQAPRKKVLLELGNSTPLIVLADANLETAAQAIVSGGYAFAGQTCISIQRVLVEEAVYAPLVELILPAVRRLRMGDPLDPQTEIGPLITPASRDRVLHWVREAVEAGAEILSGTEEPVPDQSTGSMLQPLLLTNVTPSMSVACREIFGPVVALQKVAGIEEAVAAANSTAYGLQAGIVTADFARVLRAVPQLDFGAVVVNESPSFRADQMPYGGNKASGNTREGPAYAAEEYSQYRTVVFRYGN